MVTFVECTTQQRAEPLNESFKLRVKLNHFRNLRSKEVVPLHGGPPKIVPTSTQVKRHRTGAPYSKSGLNRYRRPTIPEERVISITPGTSVESVIHPRKAPLIGGLL